MIVSNHRNGCLWECGAKWKGQSHPTEVFCTSSLRLANRLKRIRDSDTQAVLFLPRPSPDIEGRSREELERGLLVALGADEPRYETVFIVQAGTGRSTRWMERRLVDTKHRFQERVFRVKIRLPLEYDDFLAGIKDAQPVSPGDLEGR